MLLKHYERKNNALAKVDQMEVMQHNSLIFKQEKPI